MVFTHDTHIPKYLHGVGVEVGAFTTPLPHIAPIYTDRFAEYAGKPTLADVLCDSTELPFPRDSLDYVASSHVLEHVANPVRALAWWSWILRHGGILYAVVPDRRFTFDHPRPLTPIDHFFDDYRRGVSQVDGTHIDDFVYGVDWAKFSPATAPEHARAQRDEMASTFRRSIEAGLEINIHFHTFESASLHAILERGNREEIWDGEFELLEIVEEFPANNPLGFLCVARIKKPIERRLYGQLSRVAMGSDLRAALLARVPPAQLAHK